jgi:hypothetical protein
VGVALRVGDGLTDGDAGTLAETAADALGVLLFAVTVEP